MDVKALNFVHLDKGFPGYCFSSANFAQLYFHIIANHKNEIGVRHIGNFLRREAGIVLRVLALHQEFRRSDTLHHAGNQTVEWHDCGDDFGDGLARCCQS